MNGLGIRARVGWRSVNIKFHVVITFLNIRFSIIKVSEKQLFYANDPNWCYRVFLPMPESETVKAGLCYVWTKSNDLLIFYFRHELDLFLSVLAGSTVDFLEDVCDGDFIQIRKRSCIQNTTAWNQYKGPKNLEPFKVQISPKSNNLTKHNMTLSALHRTAKTFSSLNLIPESWFRSRGNNNLCAVEFYLFF